MALHQQTRQAMQRVVRPAAEDREAPASHAAAQHEPQPDESQTWVLFSSATDAATTSYLSQTEASLETPGRSRLSDIGSSDTVARSDRRADGFHISTLSAVDDFDVEDDAELDSLDSHLPEFRSLPAIYSESPQDGQHALPVLPGHDGLGSFRLDQPALGTAAQDQIYQFERFNPRRARRRRESFERAQPEPDYGHDQETEKRQMIEAWRLEQSRVLLEDIQRETRRRRRSQTPLHRRQPSNSASVQGRTPGEVDADDMIWHDEDGLEAAGESEGYLARFTRTVVKDLLGIDDRLLSILIGETQPSDDDLSTTPRASRLSGRQSPAEEDESPWHLHLLERVSRELGLLVSHLSQHPGAFSTFTRVQQMPLPYAGLPVIPESAAPADAEGATTSPGQASVPDFQPTIGQATAQPMAIPGRPGESLNREDVSMGNTFTKEEWEQDLDIKLVFRYLRSRFTSRPSNTSTTGSSSSYLATSSTHDTAAKAARVRQHHPLISRARPAERRAFKASAPGSPVALRHPSSCASQSTRRSARRSSCSSRHYWDIGGSLGTGSVIAPNGPMGSWGEV